MAQQQQDHGIFDDIERGDLAAVQQRVRADAAVLEERESSSMATPLIHAIYYKKPVIALWIIQHREQHDIDTASAIGSTALHWASSSGQLEVVRALVAAGANPAALTRTGSTPLIVARSHGHTDIVTFLLQLATVKASIDAICQDPGAQENVFTALSVASAHGYQSIVRLLLDAGADSTIPAGPISSLNQAISNNHHAIAALLRHVAAEAERARALHKARSLLGAGAASLACLQGRVEQGQAVPLVESITFKRHQQALQRLQHLLQQHQLQQVLQDLQEHQCLQRLQLQLYHHQQQQQEQKEKLRATVAFEVGVSGGEKDYGLCDELYGGDAGV